jgi:hypothetical protein
MPDGAGADAGMHDTTYRLGASPEVGQATSREEERRHELHRAGGHGRVSVTLIVCLPP